MLFLAYLYFLLPSVLSWGPGGNYANVSVKTTVNVTSAYPEILNISCNNGQAITLNAGTTKNVTCLVQIQEFNGGNTITGVNETFYYYLNKSSDPNANNTHYTDSTCSSNSTSGWYTNWTCSVALLYYANNGSWRANVSAINDHNQTTNDYRNATISSLYALNVTSLIDFGSMAVGDTTIDPPVQANVTNFGNMNINVSVYGYGGNDSVTGTGLAMICQIRNITLPNERYSINQTIQYGTMSSITGSSATIGGLTVLHQTSDVTQEINTTYWRLHVNLSTNPFGVCNGTVVFAALAP